jgi:hypothetical protein
MNGELDLTGSRSKGYFVPLADLLTGLVFILIIVLTAAQITDRPEFAADRERENQRRSIQADIQRLNALAEQRVRPAERIESQFKHFIQRLQDMLAARGIRAEADIARGLVLIDEQAVLVPASGSQPQRRPLTATGGSAAPSDAVADVLHALLGCADAATVATTCAGLRDLRHRRVIIAVAPQSPQPASEASAAALMLTARLVERQPALAALRDAQGRQIIEAHGVRLAPSGGVALAFDVERPTLPEGAWLLKDAP